MAEVMITLKDKHGNEIMFATGFGRNYGAAKAAAMVGIRARLDAADRATFARVAALTVEAL